MRVAMVGWEYPPFKTGGLAVHCFELTHALAKKGVEIDFFMPNTGSRVLPAHNSVNIVPVGFARFGAYASRGSCGEGFFSSVCAFNSAAAAEVGRRGRRKRYDLIHHHDWLTALAAIEAKRALGVPMVSTFHSTEWDRSGMWPDSQVLGIEGKAISRADRVIAVSNYMKGQLVGRFGADEGNVSVVYNGVNAAEFRKRWEFRRGREKIVLFLGRLTEQKAPAQFLYAARKVLQKERRVRFVIAGAGDMQSYLVGLAVSLGISRHVTFIGYLPDEQKPFVYAKSDVYVMPSVSEPFGITALEAMASGTPVLLSKTSGASEITPHRLTVDFWDVDAMAEKIVALLRYRVLRETLGRNEHCDAEALTWDRAAEGTLEVYRSVAGK
jgi:glycosyltransferase involved in cell wall biosynthesis